MVGSGALTFAVWSYVLGKMKPNRKDMEFYLEINPVLLGAILGEESGEVARVVSELCGPDDSSRTPDLGGRRLVRVGTFLYRVVNGAKYNDLSSYEHRRQYQRVKQAQYRKENKKKKKPAVESSSAGAKAEESSVDRNGGGPVSEPPVDVGYEPELGGYQ